MSQKRICLKWLANTFVIGLSLNACFSALAISHVSLSIFPFIALYFSLSHFYGPKGRAVQSENTIRPAWAAFFIGLFSYSAFLGAQHPEHGSIIFSIAIVAVLSIWLTYTLMLNNKQATS